VFRTDVFVPEALCLFRSEVSGCAWILAKGTSTEVEMRSRMVNALFDLFADGLIEPWERRKRLASALSSRNQAEQQMFRFDVRGSILAGLVAREKYDAACLLCVAFNHGSLVSPSCKIRALVYPQPAGAIRALTQHAICALRQNCVVRCQDGGELVLAMQSLHQLKNRDCVSLVEISGGLVGQQQGRLLHKSASDRHALLLPSGQLPCTLVARASRPTSLSQRASSSASPYPARASAVACTFSAAVISQKVGAAAYETNGAIAIIRKFALPKRFYRFLFEVYCTARRRV